MIFCLIVVWLIVWNWVEIETFESCMRGNKRTFPKLFILHFDLPKFKFISSQNPRVKIIWLLPFEEIKRGLKMIWIPFENISNQKHYATQGFSWENITGLLQNIWNGVESDEEHFWISFGSLLESFPFWVSKTFPFIQIK